MTDSRKNKRPRKSILRPVTGPNALHLSDIFRNETTGGMLMLAATVAALLLSLIHISEPTRPY